MKKIKYNLNENPTLQSKNVAYLVDINNVDIMRQYITKHYTSKPFNSETWANWFDNVIGCKIQQNPTQKYSLYFQDNDTIYWDTAKYAYRYDYEIYYMRPLMKVMTIE